MPCLLAKASPSKPVSEARMALANISDERASSRNRWQDNVAGMYEHPVAAERHLLKARCLSRGSRPGTFGGAIRKDSPEAWCHHLTSGATADEVMRAECVAL